MQGSILLSLKERATQVETGNQDQIPGLWAQAPRVWLSIAGQRSFCPTDDSVTLGPGFEPWLLDERCITLGSLLPKAFSVLTKPGQLPTITELEQLEGILKASS